MREEGGGVGVEGGERLGVVRARATLTKYNNKIKNTKNSNSNYTNNANKNNNSNNAKKSKNANKSKNTNNGTRYSGEPVSHDANANADAPAEARYWHPLRSPARAGQAAEQGFLGEGSFQGRLAPGRARRSRRS